jgi:predicted enzyme related to lactoylglutathione lyase
MADDIDRYPSGVPCWIDTTHPDAPAAAEFYGPLFGWDFRTVDGRLIAARDGRDVAGIGGSAGAPAWTTYVRVDSADDAIAAVRDAGGTVLAEPADVGTAGRAATFADPAGAVLGLWQAGAHRGAGAVNVDGAWNWSNLHTLDPADARAFYGAVFGWDAIELGPSAMWTRPGYVDVLDALDPSRRERHAQDGVPDAFGDAIGWLVPGDGPAHWAVTFAVADTDKTVAQAVDLGATVRVAPHSAPMVRIAELTDPQGVQFTVNTFTPEG